MKAKHLDAQELQLINLVTFYELVPSGQCHLISLCTISFQTTKAPIHLV